MDFITLLNDVGPQNITVGCWELNYNMSFAADLSEHPIIILWGSIEQALSVELCYIDVK